MSRERTRIGVFGGSFHPPHEGHLRAAERFIEGAKLDFLFVIPAYLPPHKELDGGATAAQRLEMTRIAFLPLSNKVRVLSMEIDGARVAYTVDTLSTLQREFSECEFFLYTGSDLFLTFETWREFRRLFSLCTVAVLAREGDLARVEAHAAYLERTYGARTLVLGECITVSSGGIREKLRQGKCPGHLSPHVLEYIENHSLYRKEH